jgi:hypothetical protein
MNDNQLFSGSLCITDLLNKAKEKHSAFTKADNGKIYCNLNIWLNAEADKYGNSMSLQLQSKKDFRDAEGKVYVGNAKVFEKKETPLSEKDRKVFEDAVDDLPF